MHGKTFINPIGTRIGEGHETYSSDSILELKNNDLLLPVYGRPYMVDSNIKDLFIKNNKS